MVDSFNRGAGECASPRSTTVREINAEEHHNPSTSMRSLFQFPLRRRAAASFNRQTGVTPELNLTSQMPRHRLLAPSRMDFSIRRKLETWKFLFGV